ncbi:hypothetical protein AB0K60_32390 [Thermopolyspora sp. NPDC052614]|uniref:hypothetical protein n=1 Tax=Thermopolyspora sp. NPDC052614 TaxID=3155682 RepID=UPI00341CB964
MDADKSWLSEFTVTPHVAHAVEVLRAAIPRRGDLQPGDEGITVTRNEYGGLTAESSRVVDALQGRQEFEDFTLTEEQADAAKFLLDTIAYYYALIEQNYEEPDDEAIKAYSTAAVRQGVEPPDGLLAAENRLVEDVMRKLNMHFEVHSLDGDSLSIYS